MGKEMVKAKNIKAQSIKDYYLKENI